MADRHSKTRCVVEQQANIEKHSLFEKVNQWEKKSMEMVIQTANETRQTLTKKIFQIYLSQSIPQNSVWSQNGITVAGGNGQGDQLNQLDSASSFCFDEHETIL